MSRLTPRQQDVLRFIDQYTREHHQSPRIREIATHFGFSPPAGGQHVMALERHGLIDHNPYREPCLALTEAGRAALTETVQPWHDRQKTRIRTIPQLRERLQEIQRYWERQAQEKKLDPVVARAVILSLRQVERQLEHDLDLPPGD